MKAMPLIVLALSIIIFLVSPPAGWPPILRWAFGIIVLAFLLTWNREEDFWQTANSPFLKFFKKITKPSSIPLLFFAAISPLGAITVYYIFSIIGICQVYTSSTCNISVIGNYLDWVGGLWFLSAFLGLYHLWLIVSFFVWFFFGVAVVRLILRRD